MEKAEVKLGILQTFPIAVQHPSRGTIYFPVTISYSPMGEVTLLNLPEDKEIIEIFFD